jgi:hypothetical protein
LAEAGVEKALYRLTMDDTYTGEVGAVLGDGTFTVQITNLSDGKKQVDSGGFIPNSTNPSAVRKIRVIAKRPDNPATAGACVVGLTEGKNFIFTGNATIDGKTGSAVQVPNLNMVTVKGGPQIIGNPPIAENTPPSFKDTFGLTEEEMKALANVYENPKNNFPNPANGITWVEGDAQYTKSGWCGQGILIVTGDLILTGGVFNGIIYVMGNADVSAGNADVNGAVFIKGEAKFAGINSVEYDVAAVNGVGQYYPYKVISWEEI